MSAVCGIFLQRMMKKPLCFTLLLGGALAVAAQHPCAMRTVGEASSYVVVYDCYNLDEEPQYPGGESALTKYINRSREYPRRAYRNRVQGRVTCGFVVNTDGSISNIEVIRGVDPDLDREAVRVISGMPRWLPGRLSGTTVPTYYTVTVPFRL